jgi:hypothetical protein
MSGGDSRLLLLLEYVQANGRICPVPQRWNQLWEMLPGRRRVGNGWIPPLPLILGAWHYTGLEKVLRLREHIEYAATNGALDEVNTFLRGLEDAEWHRID